MPIPIAFTAAQAADLNNALDKHADMMTAVGDRIDEFYNRVETVEGNLEKLNANGTFAGVRGAGASGPNVANLFSQSDQFAALKAGQNSTGRVTIDAGIAGLRAATTLTSDTGGYGTSIQLDPRLGNVQAPRLQLLDVLPVVEVDSGTFTYNVLEGYVNAAAYQAHQGDAKAQGSVPASIVTANIATIAHYIKASNQVLQDASQLQTQLTGLLSYGVRQKLENEVINGAGGAGQINGLLPLATAYASTFTTAADRIGDAATNLASAGWSPSVVVLSPADWFAISSAKSTGSGDYLLGSPRNPSPASLWGLPVALSPSIAAGTALVLDAAQTALLDRMQVVVMASRDDGSNFTTNQTTLLAEARAGLAVFSPSAVLKVALTADDE